jgi:hypothetical protein
VVFLSWNSGYYFRFAYRGDEPLHSFGQFEPVVRMLQRSGTMSVATEWIGAGKHKKPGFSKPNEAVFALPAV